MKLKSLIGTRTFYKRVLSLVIPIMVQTGITNFVNMLDNIMVGRVGTLPMTGVAVANQLVFVFNLCIFGAVSGAGIFVAQFYGKGDHKGVRETFRFKMLTCIGLGMLGIAVFYFFGKQLMSRWLTGEGSAQDAAQSLEYAAGYLRIILIGLLPYAVSQCYSGTLRETDKALPPMFAGVSAVIINLILNYILIFGHFGAPAMGANGAAVATVISRYAELLIIVVWTHVNKEKNRFIEGAYRSFHISGKLIKDITVKGLPLMLNETMWSAGITMLNQCYSVRSLDVVSATNICSTFFNVFSVVFMSFGTSIGIIVGQQLGAHEDSQAKDTAKKMIALSVAVSFGVTAVFFFAAPYIPLIYNTTDSIRTLAMQLMRITALLMPLDAFAHASYFTLRSGGKVFITILFDSVFVWALNVPSALGLIHLTQLNILAVFAIVESEKIIKDIIGFILIRSGIWVRNIVEDERESNLPVAE